MLCNFQITKDNLLSKLVMLWYNTAGCPEKFAFRPGLCLTSGFEQCGLFPFSPEVIRRTVKAHHGAACIDSSPSENVEPDFSVIINELEIRCGISSEEDIKAIKEYIMRIKRGVTPGRVLHNVCVCGKTTPNLSFRL